MQNDTRIALDIAKAVFEIAISDRPGRVVRTLSLRRGQFLEFFAQQPAATVVMEACASAHYWARRTEQLGQRVVLLTARLNALRGLLRELGVFIPVGADNVVPAVWALVEDADSDLPDALRPLFAEGCQEIRDIEACIKQTERQLEALAEQLPARRLPAQHPWIGLLTATALVAFIGDLRRSPTGS